MRHGMIIRELTMKDLPEMVNLWNQNLAFDPVSETLLHEKTFGDYDLNAGMTLVAEVEGKIAAFMQGLYRRTHKGEKVGWIKLCFTAGVHRRRGIASELLNTIETKLITAGVSRIQIFDSNPNYLIPGVDPYYTETIAFVERRGYKKFDDTCNLIADLSQDLDTSAEEAALPNDVEIRRAQEGDRNPVAQFIGQEWPAWVPEVAIAFKNQPLSLHLGFYRGELKAFSAYDVNNVGTGWFGPMGTDPVFRGKGVGGILLKRCLQDIKNQGLKQSIIPWVGPIPFYMHYVNARVQRVFWRYRKELK